ncbi:MAG: amidophosphoribosyltransferase [Gammaproteobacteria bacterium]|nr:amidophosphoribosyltransferase [SAR86 cluster bacterium]MDC3144836.1 amidophosphoribosyltransferase [SAR86 cluster bacterium]
MCGVVGLVSKNEVSPSIYEALTVIQHRGQDAAGIATLEEGRLHTRKQIGLVRDVFREKHINELRGQIGIGHVRYPTAGGASREFSQPLYVNSPYGISISHNGNLVNAEQLTKELYKDNYRHLNTSSDSEVILNVFAHELQQASSFNPTPEQIFKAVEKTHLRLQGAYSVLLMISGVGLVGIRDPKGIRPLILGKKDNDLIGSDYMIASESPALSALEFEIEGDLKPGEAVFITLDGEIHRKVCHSKPSKNPCIFEYVYLARPDAVIDGISVMRSRLRMGQKLGKKILETYPDHDIDAVIPIPESSTSSAIEVAKTLNVNYREGFVKNRYIGRTFIMPKQELRKKSVRRKLNPIPFEFKDKNVLLVDDSIVRGTTSREIVEMARSVGAKKVYFASAAPPVRYQNVYGIDMAATAELIAHQRSEEQIADFIGADWLIYQDLDDLIESAKEGNPKISNFETSVFDGDYICGSVTKNYLTNLEIERKDANKKD